MRARRGFVLPDNFCDSRVILVPLVSRPLARHRARSSAVSASAPLRAFPGQSPQWDSSAYYAVITHDLSAAGGSAEACEPSVRALWPLLAAAAKSPAGRAQLAERFRTCDAINSADDALALAFWVRGNFDSMSMGGSMGRSIGVTDTSYTYGEEGTLRFRDDFWGNTRHAFFLVPFLRAAQATTLTLLRT